MSRHIRIRAEYDPHYFSDRKVIVTVEEQTHRNYELVPYENEFVHGDIILRSVGCPAFSEFWPGGSKSVMFLRGRETRMDNNKVRLTVEQCPKVKEAIEAYNEKFK